MGDGVPDLKHEKDLWEAGRAILQPEGVENLPEMEVERMAREVIQQSDEIDAKVASADEWRKRAEEAEARCAEWDKATDACPRGCECYDQGTLRGDAPCALCIVKKSLHEPKETSE